MWDREIARNTIRKLKIEGEKEMGTDREIEREKERRRGGFDREMEKET